MLLPVTCRAVCWAARLEPPRCKAPNKLTVNPSETAYFLLACFLLLTSSCHRSTCDFEKMNSFQCRFSAVPQIETRMLGQTGHDFQYFRQASNDGLGDLGVDACVSVKLFDH